jgi:PAS domain S-box-containing protein
MDDQRPSADRINRLGETVIRHLILMGVSLGLVFYIVDALIAALFLESGTLNHQLFSPESSEITYRLIVLGLFVLFGVIAQKFVNHKINAHQILHRSETKFRQLFQTVPVGYLSLDLRGRIIEANEVWLATMGYTRAEVVGHVLEEFMAEDSKKRFLTVYKCLSALGAYHVDDLFIACKDGQKISFTFDGRVVTDEDGVFMNAQCAFYDITEQKQAEIALKESEERFRALVNFSPDAIVVYCEGKVTFVNQAAVRLLGAGCAENLIGKDFLSLVHPDHHERARYPLQIVTDEAQLAPLIEVKIKRLDGGIIDAEIAATLHKYLGKTSIQAVLRDVSERKHTELRLKKLNDSFLHFESDPLVNINRLTALTGELLGAACALYNRLEGGQLCALGQWNAPPDFISKDDPEGHICFEVMRQGLEEVVIIRNLADTSYAQSDPNVTKYKLMTYMGKTVRLGQDYVGTLCAVYQKDVEPDEEDQKIIKLAASAIAIEEKRRQAMYALRDSEAKYSHLVDMSPDAIVLHSEGKLIFVNQAAVRLFGCASADNMIGKPVLEFVHPDYREIVKRRVQEITIEKTTVPMIEEKFLRYDGSTIDVEVVAAPFPYQGNNTVQVVLRDITERKKAEQALIQISTRQNAILAAAPDIIAEVNQDKIYTWLNRAGLEFFGDNAIGKEAASFFEGEQETYKSVQPIFEGGEDVLYIESWQRRKDGEKRLLAWWCRVLKDNDGSVTGALSTARDITERIMIEQALISSEQRYRDLFQRNLAGVFRTTPAGKVLDCNEAFVHIMGFTSREQALSLNAQNYYTHPGDREKYLENLRKLGVLTNYVQRLARPDGSLLWVLENVSLIRNGGDDTEVLEGTIIDITELRQVEEALKLTQFSVDHAADYIFWINSAGQIIYVNETVCQRLGYRREELLNLTIHDLDPNFPREVWIKHWNDLKRNKSLTVETLHRTKEGALIPVEVAINYYEYNGQEINFAFARDITERKRTESALRESEAKFRSLFESSHDAFMTIFPPDWKFTSANSAMVKMFCAKDENEITSRGPWDLSPERQPDGELSTTKAPRMIATAMEQGSHFFEWAHQRINGDVFPATVLLTRVELDGKLGLQATVRDISRHKQAEDLADARARILQFSLTGNLDDILRNVLDEAEALTNSSISFFHFLDADQKTLRLHGWSTRTSGEFCTAKGTGAHFKVSQAGVWADGVRERRAVIHDDYHALPHRKGLPEGHAIVNRFMSIPIFRQDKIVAVIGIGNKEKSYDEKDVAIVTQLADLSWDIVERKRTEEELRKSEERYRVVADNTYDWEFWISPDEKYLYQSPSCERITGHSAEEFEKDPKLLERIIHPEDLSLYLAHRDEVIGKHTQGTVVFRILTTCGDERWIEHHCQAIFDKAGNFLGNRGSNRDITARINAENEIREREDRFRTLVENQGEGVSIIDLNENFLFANPAAENLYGVPSGGLMGRKATDFLDEEQQIILRNQTSTRPSGVKSSYELKIKRPDGEYCDIIITATPLYDTDGQVKSVLGVFRDITDRKRDEASLSQSLSLLQATLESTTDGILVVNGEGKVTGHNDQFVKMWNIPPEVVASKEDEKLLNHVLEQLKDPQVFINKVRELYEHPDTSSFDILEFKDGRVFERYSLPQRINGQPVGRVWSFRNVTERIRGELEQVILYSISDAVVTVGDLDSLLNTVHTKIKKVMYAENCYIALYNSTTEIVSFPFFADQFDETPTPRARKRGFTEYVLRTGAPLLLTPDKYDELVRNAEVEPIGTPPISWLGVPLFIQSKSIGVLVIQSYEQGHDYTSREQDLLAAIGNQAAYAIERQLAQDELKKSEEKYRTLVDNTEDGVSVIQEGCVRFVNKAFHKIFGYSEDDVAGKNPLTVVAPEDLDRVKGYYQRRQKGENVPVEYEFIGLHSDGITRPMIHLTVNEIIFHGKPAFMYTLRDVTDRHKREKEREVILNTNKMLLGELDTERALHGLGEELKALIPHNLLALSLIKKDQDQVELILATTAGSSSELDGYMEVPGDYFETYQGSLTQQIIYDRRNRLQGFIPENGTKFERNLALLGMKSYLAVPLVNVGVPLGMLFLASERTDAFTEQNEQLLQQIQPQLSLYIQHQRLIERVLDSESKYRRLFECSNDIIYILQDKRFVYVNPRFEELLEFKLDEVNQPDFNFMKLVAPESVPLIEERTRRVAAGEIIPPNYEFKALSKSGKVLDVDVSVSYVTYEGKPAVQGILRDISERKRLEARQKEMQLELIQHAKLSSIGMLAAGIAHNVNVPLQGLINHIELLKLTRDDLPYMEDMLNQAQRISAIINNMLFKSRQEQDRENREINLNQLLIEELNFLNADLVFKHRVQKEFNFDPSLPALQGIYSDFSQALINLIKNALDAMHDCPVKRLGVRTMINPKEEIVVQISDSGCGIPSEHLPHIFDPFFTTKPSNGRQNGSEPTGTGLGLSSAYQLLKKYDARIEVDSEVGKGTTFSVCIPLLAKRAEEAVAEIITAKEPELLES